MKTIIDGITYSYEVHGEGEALLLLHGFTGSKKTWDPFISKWSSSNKVIAVDIVGHGETDSPIFVKEYEIEKVARDIAALLDFLQVEKAHILGYSMGGRLAIAIAALYPGRVRSLLLESTTAGIQSAEEREKRRQHDCELGDKIEAEGIGWFVDYWENVPLFGTQKLLSFDVQNKVRMERLQQKEIGLANSLRGMGTGSQRPYWEELKYFSFPTLVLFGGLDEKFCQIAALLMEQLPNAFLEKFIGTGHALHVENQEKFGRIVSDWLVRK